MSDVDENMDQTAQDFTNVVEPEICDWFDSDVVNVENVTDNDIAKKLDVDAGIDYWRVGELMAGIGSRIQWLDETPYADQPYDTFTVRCETPTGQKRSEYEKRLYAIENDGLYPKHTVQAYLDSRGGKLLSVGEVSTRELIKYIKNGEEGERRFRNGKPVVEGGEYWRQHRGHENDFYAIPWTELESNKHGIHVRKLQPYKEGPEEHIPHKLQAGLNDFATDGGDTNSDATDDDTRDQ